MFIIFKSTYIPAHVCSDVTISGNAFNIVWLEITDVPGLLSNQFLFMESVLTESLDNLLDGFFLMPFIF